jgi:ribosomal protection tetracycline resistance protein
MHTLNLGILAHEDAGKTSLTERLLYAAGVIKSLGSVDAGSTQTDPLALQRQRGITIARPHPWRRRTGLRVTSRCSSSRLP